ncbi:hypothetical protein D3C76_755500 [compost metagenome]
MTNQEERVAILLDVGGIDISSAPVIDFAPVDHYVGAVMPDDDDFEFTAFDIGVMPAQPIPHKEKEVVAPTNKPKDAVPYKRKTMESKLPEFESLDTFIQLPESIMDTVIGRLAKVVADCVEFPEASTFLSLLGSASAAVAANYAVQYRTGSPVTTGLYVIVEQPPATQKSYILGMGMNPYSMAMGEHNKRVKAKVVEMNERISKDDPSELPKYGFVVATDATSAAMDKHLSDCSEGRFVIASAEQSALISLFPEGNSFASTNELILKGYAGEYVAGMRGGRAAFSGMANGSVVLIAQSNTSRRVLAASNGSGMAERFIFMAEPSNLGGRHFEGGFPTSEERRPFESAVRACIAQYSDKVLAGLGIVMDPENLEQLRASAHGYQMIKQARKDMEPRLGELKESGDMVLLSWLGKYETHALKVASVLHVFECLGNGVAVPNIIPDATLDAAMQFVEVMSDHMEQLLHDAGESGNEAEEEAVILTMDGRKLSTRTLVQRLRNKKPFKAMGKAGYKAAENRVAKMISMGILLVGTDGNLSVV